MHFWKYGFKQNILENKMPKEEQILNTTWLDVLSKVG